MSNMYPEEAANLSHSRRERQPNCSCKVLGWAQADQEKEWARRGPGSPGFSTAVLHTVTFKTGRHVPPNLSAFSGLWRKPSLLKDMAIPTVSHPGVGMRSRMQKERNFPSWDWQGKVRPGMLFSGAWWQLTWLLHVEARWKLPLVAWLWDWSGQRTPEAPSSSSTCCALWWMLVYPHHRLVFAELWGLKGATRVSAQGKRHRRPGGLEKPDPVCTGGSLWSVKWGFITTWILK